MKNIIFIAPPAAGKGTQSEMLKEEYGYVHISTGDMLREATLSGTEFGNKVKDIIEKGGLIDDKTMISLIKNKLAEIKGKPFILDGFPRTLAQATSLNLFLEEKHIDYVTIYLELDEKIAMERVLGRLTCKCGKSYNTFHKELSPSKEGICDYCGEALIKRKDDNEESFKVRYKTFIDSTKPLIYYYEDLKKLLRIDASLTTSKIFDTISGVVHD